VARLPTRADVRQVRGISIPNVRIPVEPFTAGAVAMQRAGDQLIALGEQQAEEKATADARKADAELQKKLREMRNGTLGDPDAGSNELDAGLTVTAKPGWRTLQGFGLVNAEPQLNEQIDSAYQEILSGLDDRARSKFEPVGLKRTSLEYERVSEAVIDARKKFQAEAASARADELSQTFIETGSPKDLEAFKAEKIASFFKSNGIRSLGELPESVRAQAQTLLQNEVRDGLTNVHRERINQLLVDDPNGVEALRYFNQYKDEINADQHDAISKAIKEANFKRDTAVAAENLVAEFGVAGAIKRIKASAKDKGQSWVDATLARVKALAKEQTDAVAANDKTDKKQITDLAYAGSTPRELQQRYPNWPGWKTKKGNNAVLSAYDLGVSARLGTPVSDQTPAVQDFIASLHNMDKRDLASIDLEDLRRRLTPQAYKEWAPKVLAAKGEYAFGSKKEHEKFVATIRRLADDGALNVRRTIYKRGLNFNYSTSPDKMGVLDLARKEDAIREFAHRLEALGANSDWTVGQLMGFIVANIPEGQAVTQSYFGFPATVQSASSMTTIELESFGKSGKSLEVDEDIAKVFMAVPENRNRAVNGIRTVASQARQAYKQEKVPLPANLKNFDPDSLSDQELYKIEVLLRMAEKIGQDEVLRSADLPRANAALAAYFGRVAKVAGFNWGPTETQVDEEQARQRAEPEAQKAAQRAQNERKLKQELEKVEKVETAYMEYNGSAVDLGKYLEQGAIPDFPPIPEGWTKAQERLALLHRGALLSGLTKTDKEGNPVTINSMRFYWNWDTESAGIIELPGFYNGKLLSQDEALKIAEQKGWENFPIWKVDEKTAKAFAAGEKVERTKSNAPASYHKWMEEFKKFRQADYELLKKHNLNTQNKNSRFEQRRREAEENLKNTIQKETSAP
tara:strand:+ start:8864 stop:11602 length:2739 start_codon:yes stop_codon:yes gene_type:complete